MYRYRAAVLKVIDGDTIDVDIDLGFFTILRNQRIRLHAIDAPEVGGSERFQGLEAKAWLKHQIEGKEIELVTFKDVKGKYGRWLGVVYFKSRNIDEVMVEKELAEFSDK